MYGFRGNFSCGTRRVVPSGQDSSILLARVANQTAGLNSSYNKCNSFEKEKKFSTCAVSLPPTTPQKRLGYKFVS